MAGLTYAQKFSFAETVAEIIVQNKQSLIAAGLAADKKLAVMLEKNKKVVIADAKQEKLKSDLKQATEEAVTAVEDSYKLASSNLDAIVGSLGKDNQLSRRLRKIREQMTKEALRGKRETTKA